MQARFPLMCSAPALPPRLGRALCGALLGLSLIACGNRSAILQNPGEKPSIWYIRCKQSIKQCRAVAIEVCKGEDYDVKQSTGENPVEEYVASLDSSQGGQPPPSDQNWLGEMIVECHDGEGAPPRVPKKRAVPAAAPAAAPTAPPAAAPSRPALPEGMVCIPGATQECLGPAACRGAQACAADGKSFGACDCGPAPAPAPTPQGAATDPAASPGPAPAPEAPAP